MCNVDRLVGDYEYALRTYGDWQYEERAVRKIINTSIDRKSWLIKLFSRHPKWNPENLMIQFDATIGREPDYYEADRFYYWFNDIIEDTYHGYNFTLEQFKKYQKIRRICFLFDNKSQFLEDEEIDEINRIMKNIPELERLRFNKGQKRSKAVSKICLRLGFDKNADYERRYAKYADAINPLEIVRHTCISLNSIDYLLSSNGNSWSSCHNIDKEEYSGCNCSGGISYSLDDVTVCMYTVDASYDGDKIYLEPKINRTMFYVSKDLKHFVASRTYPDGSYKAGDSFREIFEKVLSECADIPNLWIKDNNNLSEYARINYSATAYPDIEYPDANKIVHCFHKSVEKNRDSVEFIGIGAAPICVECGCEHTIKDQINCCHYFGGSYCEHCGRGLYDVGEEEVYSEYHNRYGCIHCMDYCDYNQDWYYNDEITYVGGYGNVSNDALENSGEFFYCNECEEWHYLGNTDEVETPDGYMCEYCARRLGFVQCDLCYEWVWGEDAIATDDGFICNVCAESREKEAV